jgi:predicted amidohydrolase YtcJ
MNITNIELGMRTLHKGLESPRAACGILAALTSTEVFAQQKVDTVVTNGKVLTVDADFRIVEALAINDRLRWTLGHVYDISPTNIARAKALGMTLGIHGAAMQAAAHMPLRKIARKAASFSASARTRRSFRTTARS